MTFINNWAGNIIQTANKEHERTTKTGTFTAANKIITYFPLPMIFSNLVPVIGTLKVEAKYQNRADILAKDLYGSEDLWWLIYWSNNVIDPFSGPKAGDIINIIDITKLQNLFNK